MFYLCAHVSIAGGVSHVPIRAKGIFVDAFYGLHRGSHKNKISREEGMANIARAFKKVKVPFIKW